MAHLIRTYMLLPCLIRSGRATAITDIEPSVALIKTSRNHILQLLHAIPDYWERYVLVNSADSEGHLGEARKSTVGHLLEVMASHLLEHCAEIREIRQLNGHSFA